MGTCFFKKGRHVKARDAFTKAKELFPNEKDDNAIIGDNCLCLILIIF